MKPRTHRSLSPLVLLLAVILAESALAAPFKNLRYEEDPRAMVNPEQPDFWDPVKAITFGREKQGVFSLGGQARLRWEGWNNFGFAPDNDDNFGLLRLRLHGDFQPSEYFRLFVEGKSSLSTDRDLPGGARTLDVDTLDFQNAFFDIAMPISADQRFTLRSGRQELQYGKQRLVSPLDWANTRRTFDGFRGIYEGKVGRIDAFWAQLAQIEKYDLNRIGVSDDLYGVYAAGDCPLTGMDLDLYYLGLDRDPAKFGEVVGRENRHTLGARLGGPMAECGGDLDLEAGYQFGDHAGRDISAWFFASQAGYKFKDAPTTPRLYLGFDYASGDRSGKSLNTFNQLFPLGHAYLGYIDAIGRQNIIDFNQGLFAWTASNKLLLKLENHFFWRAERTDALYNAGGGVVRAADPDAPTEVGMELDLTAKYTLDRHTVLVAGYSRFFAGDFIKATGPSEDIDFVYGSAQYTF